MLKRAHSIRGHLLDVMAFNLGSHGGRGAEFGYKILRREQDEPGLELSKGNMNKRQQATIQDRGLGKGQH